MPFAAGSFDLDADPSETLPIQDTRPGAADSLRALLQSWRERVGARVPTEPEPAYRER